MKPEDILGMIKEYDIIVDGITDELDDHMAFNIYNKITTIVEYISGVQVDNDDERIIIDNYLAEAKDVIKTIGQLLKHRVN